MLPEMNIENVVVGTGLLGATAIGMMAQVVDTSNVGDALGAADVPATIAAILTMFNMAMKRFDKVIERTVIFENIGNEAIRILKSIHEDNESDISEKLDKILSIGDNSGA